MSLAEVELLNSINKYREKYNKKSILNVGVMVSGGSDSMALLYLLNKNKEEYKLNISILHVLFDDYPSYKEAYEIIKDKAIESNIRSIVVNSKIKELVTRINETGREELKQLSYVENFDIVFTGHHKDDQIETILFRFLRGSGPEGLEGMRLFTEFKINNETRVFCKPFLNITKEELLLFAVNNNIPFVTDETNLNSESDRNFLRNEIIPKLNERFQVKNILETSRIIKENTENYKVTNLDIYSGKWHINELINLPVLNRVFVIKEYFRKVHGFTIKKGVYNELVNAFNKDLSKFRVNVGFNLEVKKKGEFIIVTKASIE